MIKRRAGIVPLPGNIIGRKQLMEMMANAKAVVCTGDFGSCCSMVLYSASGMDRYCRQV